MNSKNNSVKNAVWLGAALLAYGKYIYLTTNKINITKDSFWVSQSKIRKFSQKYCSNTIQGPRINQWYNGDHPNNTYNYLKSKGTLRRLTAYGEFNFNKEVPTDIDKTEEYEYDYLGIHISISVMKLMEWVKKTYSKIILDNSLEINADTICEPCNQDTNFFVKEESTDIKENVPSRAISTTLDFEKYIHQFMDLIRNNVVEVYNEFSLQHELGIYLRNVLNKKYKIQFERNVSYFDIQKGDMLKKEMDIVVFSEDKSEKYCIELKYPQNGQYPEQMFSMCKDVKFLEQLIEHGFTGGYSLNLVDDKVFYNDYGKEEGIYEMFRRNKRIEGTVVKPTGNKEVSYQFGNSYDIKWNDVDEKRKYFVIEVSADK